MKTRSGPIAALDIGTTKLCCLIAHAGNQDKDNGRPEPRVIGIGHQISRGLRGGVIVDMEAAESSIRSAVHAAEQMAQITVEKVIVNISGHGLSSSSFGIEVPTAGREINDSDLRRAFQAGIDANLADEREIIHSIPVSYSIDGSRGIRDPRGMFGERLGVQIHMITASAGTAINLTNCIGRCHLDVEEIISSPYASGVACLVEDEMDLGVTCVDMGGGTTSLAVFFDGNVIHTDNLPLGGNHVTSDIARGLSTTMAHAERLKTLYGSALASDMDEREYIDVPQIGEETHAQANHVPKSVLTGIIRPRLEETLEMVRDRLDESNYDKVAGQRIVLTGGASQIQGVRELASMILDKQVRIGKPLKITGLPEAASGAAFSTSTGLLINALDTTRKLPIPRFGTNEEPGGLFGRLGFWLRECF